MTAPSLSRGVRLRWDEHRQSWLLLAPERVVLADAMAAEVLRRLDGIRTEQEIVADLCRHYDAGPERIAADVGRLLAELAAAGMVRQ